MPYGTPVMPEVPSGYGRAPVQQQPVQQQPIQQTRAPTQFDELVQAIAAKRSQSEADRYQQRAGRPYGTWGSMLSGGMNQALATSHQRDADAALQEQGRLESDRQVLEEAQKRQQAMKMIMMANPGMPEEQALVAAKSVVAGLVPMEKFIPQAQELKGLEAEVAQLMALGYTKEEATKMAVEKYKGAQGAEEDGIPWGKASGDIKTRVGLISSASNLVNRSLGTIFDDEGNFRNTASLTPKGEVGIALADLREALTQTLRAVSGAAIPETEIEREVNSMVPSWTDTDKQARAKIERAKSKIGRMHSAMTSGYKGVPEDLALVDMTIPGGTDEGSTLEEQAQAAIDAGADPEMVYSRLRKLQGG